VTLHPIAISLLKRQRILSESAYVFESTSKPGSPITGDAITRALERVRIKYCAELEDSLHMIYVVVLRLDVPNI